MNKHHRSLIFFLAILSAPACSATMTSQWPDDYKNGRLKGGTFSYYTRGARSVIRHLEDSGMQQAVDWCGKGREPFVFDQNDTQSLTFEYQPVYTESIGTINSGSASAYFSSSTQSGQWLPTIRTTHSVSFLCPDAQPQEPTYAIIYEYSPRCVAMARPWTVGKKRLMFLWKDPENDVCFSEGWIRINLGKKVKHLFLGESGLIRCQKIVDEIIEAETPPDMIPVIIRKKLQRCSDNENTEAD